MDGTIWQDNWNHLIQTIISIYNSMGKFLSLADQNIAHLQDDGTCLRKL